jgi:FlaA1/EpsC-like NDP-sugar epimerase
MTLNNLITNTKSYLIMPISRRIVGQLLTDIVIVNASTFLAIVLFFGWHGHRATHYFAIAAHFAIIVTALRILSLYIFRGYRIHWRYISLHDLQNVVWATTFSSMLLGLISLNFRPNATPRLIQVLDWGINIFAIGGARLLFRWLDWKWNRPVVAEKDHHRLRTLIVGAGDAGETVARDLIRRGDSRYVPVGFVDDDPRKVNIRIHGLPILGKTLEIPDIVARLNIESILIAIPYALGKEIRDIVTICERTNAQLRILPGVTEAIQGRFSPAIRQVEIEDLLRRPPVRVDIEVIASYISDQRVLVTGAGGSIGSELCRQISSLNPKALILLGQGENSVFEIQQELFRDHHTKPIGLVGSVQDRKLLDEIFSTHRPDVVFHAAAHKHVPLMEANPCEAVKNNVQGTRNVAEIAAEYGVSRFIYVSTDKAVNPVSVMGASKRAGEMVIQALAGKSRTKFVGVRFGNVLGSRGSVVPIMKRQIEKGGPVTVTHQDMTRYFMTIPEAVQLIIQAGAMGDNGEIFILDMGEPVKIVDLARDLIKLSGLVPGQDIDIVFSGIRPGEKIYEELLTADERNRATTHEKIFVAPNQPVDMRWLWLELDRLCEQAKESYSDDVRKGLFDLVASAKSPDSPEALANAVAGVMPSVGSVGLGAAEKARIAGRKPEPAHVSRDAHKDRRNGDNGQRPVETTIAV